LSTERLEGNDPTALTEFGHRLETFAVGELVKQASWLDEIPATLAGVPTTGPSSPLRAKPPRWCLGDGMRSLAKLCDAVGPAFIAGPALYPVYPSYTFAERLLLLPVDRIWTPVG